MSDSHSKAVSIVERRDVERLHPMVSAAMAAGPDPATLRELMALQREWEAGEAKRAYTGALVALKRDLPSVIGRDKLGDYPSSKGRVTYRHTTLAHAMDAVTDVLTKHGFALTWTPSTTNGSVSVTARLTHAAGHCEETSLSGPVDNSGGKSPIQGIAATITYLERYSALALLGIATADMEEPHGARETPGKATNAARNLRVVAALQGIGKTAAQAEAHVGRKVKDWTEADIDKLRAWVRQGVQKEPPHDASTGEVAEEDYSNVGPAPWGDEPPPVDDADVPH